MSLLSSVKRFFKNLRTKVESGSIEYLCSKIDPDIFTHIHRPSFRYVVIEPIYPDILSYKLAIVDCKNKLAEGRFISRSMTDLPATKVSLTEWFKYKGSYLSAPDQIRSFLLEVQELSDLCRELSMQDPDFNLAKALENVEPLLINAIAILEELSNVGNQETQGGVPG